MSAAAPFRASVRASTSRLQLVASPVASSSRAASSSSSWPSKTHLRPAPTMPAPMPPIYPQTVVLSDGSTFTSYTTAPTPQTLRLTRDVTNNPLWAPGTDVRGGEAGEEGRVGRFMRRFDMSAAGATPSTPSASTPAASEAVSKGAGKERQRGFSADDLDWMSEGAKEEKVGGKEVKKPAAGGKRK